MDTFLFDLGSGGG